MKLDSSEGAITTPPACVPAFLTSPSSFNDKFIMASTSSSSSYLSANSEDFFKASFIVIPISKGTNFAIWSTTGYGYPSILPTSRITALAESVP